MGTLGGPFFYDDPPNTPPRLPPSQQEQSFHMNVRVFFFPACIAPLETRLPILTFSNLVISLLSLIVVILAPSKEKVAPQKKYPQLEVF